MKIIKEEIYYVESGGECFIRYPMGDYNEDFQWYQMNTDGGFYPLYDYWEEMEKAFQEEIKEK